MNRDRSVAKLVCAMGLFACWPGFCSAQMFGERQFGKSLRKPSASSAGGGSAASGGTGVGTISGSERFLRSNRSPGAFVGANKDQSFIGANPGGEGATDPNAITNPSRLAIRNPNIAYNLPRGMARPTGPYEPRLVVGFEPPTSAVTITDRQLREQLLKLDPQRFEQVSVVLTKGTVHLKGQVSTPHDRDLAATLLAFEPGVDVVHNELVVVARTPPSKKPAP